MLPDKTRIRIEIKSDVLTLDIEGIEDIMVEMVEPLSWLVCVGGGAQIKTLESHVKGKSTATTLQARPAQTYLIEPRIAANPKTKCFQVVFENTRVQSPSAKGGGCWKDMVGLAFVAKGYSTPPRPHAHSTTPWKASGLEAGLEVSLEGLLELCLARDGPAGRWKSQEAGKPEKLLVATGCEQGNIFYWHYLEVDKLDSISKPFKFYLDFDTTNPGLEAIQRPESLAEKSRHFIGWSGDAKFLAGTSQVLFILPTS